MSKRPTSKLLIQEAPLQVLPSLAKAIGLNEAIVLQQVHYWLERSKHEYQGQSWFYKTDEDFHAEFSFWSVNTFRRTVSRLKERGLLLVDHLHGELMGNKFNRTKWYTVNYEELDRIHTQPKESASTQNEQIEADTLNRVIDPPKQGNTQNEQMASTQSEHMAFTQNEQLASTQSEQMAFTQNGQMLHKITTENTSEITSENTSDNAADAAAVDLNSIGSNQVPATATATATASSKDQDEFVNSRKRFRIKLNWKPSKRFMDRFRGCGFSLSDLSEQDQQDVISEFSSYWNSTPHQPATQEQWEQRFEKQIYTLQEWDKLPEPAVEI